MKKILALVFSVVMIVSMFTITANAAVEGCSVTANAVIENVDGYDYIKLVISATIPDTLVPYKVNQMPTPPFTKTYEGLMLQTAGFDITIPDGMVYIDAMSSVSEPLALNVDNASLYKLYHANMGGKETYYAGEVATLATLYFWTADLEQTYNFDVTNAVIGLVDVNTSTGAIAPREYTFGDFAITNATVAPAQPEPEEEKVVMTAAPFITDVATSTEAKGWQAGQAVALQFATADLAKFDAMNWKLTVAGVNKFAKVDDAAFATIKATAAETVDVFASFIVNTAENTEATPITAVSAGFKKADGTVVEAE